MIFGFAKDTSIDEIAAEIDKNYKKFFKISKEKKKLDLSIKKTDLEKAFKSQEQFKISKKKAQWKLFVGDIVFHFSVDLKNKDEFKGTLSGTSTFPGFFINTTNIGKLKRTMCMPIPDNEKGLDVKNLLIKKYKFKDLMRGIS